MSQFSTITPRERKMQAAAICREVYGSEDAALDLGKKMCVPQEIMSEELSLASNRGSRLFKMRQKRSEKYTFESIQNVPNAQISNGEEGQSVGPSDDHNTETGPSTPDRKTEPNPDSIAPGYGGPLKDIPAEKFNITAVPKSYHSPWDQAIITDPDLADTLVTRMPEPGLQPQPPGYKSFNRVATPFRGFGSSPGVKQLEPLEVNPLLVHPEPHGADAELNPRPTFNRSALGWVSVSPAQLPRVSMEAMLIPESDDL